MNRFSALGLSLATLLVSLAIPVSLQPLPGGTVAIETAEAVATSALINVSGQIGPEHERTLSSGRTMRLVTHTFQGRRGQSITISLTSQDFKTVVALVDGNTREVLDTQPKLTPSATTLLCKSRCPTTALTWLVSPPLARSPQAIIACSSLPGIS